MGAWGALIMGFFGAVFAALTLSWQWHVAGPALAAPFAVFAIIAVAAGIILRMPGEGIKPSPKVERVIMWSSIGEGIGLFLAANIVINLHRDDLLLPAMALVVGLHFLPIALAAAFRPFLALGSVLIVCALAGVVVGASFAGCAAAGGLWIAAVFAVRRDWRTKRLTQSAAS